MAIFTLAIAAANLFRSMCSTFDFQCSVPFVTCFGHLVVTQFVLRSWYTHVQFVGACVPFVMQVHFVVNVSQSLLSHVWSTFHTFDLLWGTRHCGQPKRLFYAAHTPWIRYAAKCHPLSLLFFHGHRTTRHHRVFDVLPWDLGLLLFYGFLSASRYPGIDAQLENRIMAAVQHVQFVGACAPCVIVHMHLVLNADLTLWSI